MSQPNLTTRITLYILYLRAVHGAFENLSGSSSFRSGLCRLRSPVRRIPFTAATAPITAAIVDFFVAVSVVPGVVVVVGGGPAAAAARPPPVGRVGTLPGPGTGPLAGAAALPAEVGEMKFYLS